MFSWNKRVTIDMAAAEASSRQAPGSCTTRTATGWIARSPKKTNARSPRPGAAAPPSSRWRHGCGSGSHARLRLAPAAVHPEFHRNPRHHHCRLFR